MSTLPEERVLKPLDPVPNDVNDWPDFALRETKIFYQGKGRYADLLQASEETPLCVVGELMPLDDEQEHIALIEKPLYARIKIDNVTNYSFGQDDNGKPVIWAAGKAGWYEISPSDRYLSHYNDTLEAIDLFYFMVDQHQKLARKHQKFGFMIDPFLTEYQKHTGYRIDDDDEAMETIHKHHRFLLRQMLEEREGIDWSQTYLWKHLAETYADELEELKATLASSNQNSLPEASDSSEEEDADEDEDEVDEGPRQEREGTSEGSDGDESEASSEAASSSATETKPEPIDWTRPIWDMLNILRKSANFNMRHCGIDEAATELQKLPAFEGSHEDAVAAFERSAEPLLKLMNEAKLRKKFNWSTRRIYDELEATLADVVADETMKTPRKPGGGKPQRHRMKSVLRPSGASKSHKRARGVVEEDEDEVMSDVPISSPVARRQAGPPPPSRMREATADSAPSREDSPSRQLNGHLDPDALPELPPGPEAQEMIDLVAQEAKRVGRQHQTSHLQAFLGQWVV
ncbi:uncharacterized protein Z520_00448 [Fonsecaea multimorphosa CBS 102226]|uniref:DNA (cytosine-5)-methyltransferase 1 replication foci domain-containing protein n=1 Tax=Fonsecaea multimorphosa CBS 102226 TaxID=1442371 RepID=A0A0D2J2U2_9EURO|nr:uncharacterized protein Z520_00448 [Fonsecaea multimorphosa CBS 102226]KIY03757.1 hypothetical protein Z520_00448 [Fonsecaea multimorphosa CBS 102226]OAL32450.1 hypothetical protein AYO22_00472 [Fonsecaea multimorphosa]